MSKQMNKGEVYDFKTEFSTSISKIILRVEWESDKYTSYAPMDLSCSITGSYSNPLDLIYLDKLSNDSKTVVHQGDDSNNMGEISFEEIHVNLEDLDLYLDGLAFTVFANPSIIGGNSVIDDEKIILDKCLAILINADNGNEICKYEIEPGDVTDNSIIMCAISRTDHGWYFKAIGDKIGPFSFQNLNAKIKTLKLGRSAEKGYFRAYLQIFKYLPFKYILLHILFWLMLFSYIFYMVYQFIKSFFKF
jgi:tellurium resistance protein TerD